MWELSDDEKRSSFEILWVHDLPPIDRDDIRIVPSLLRRCGCHHCKGNWPKISRVAVEILEAGIDPLDHDAIVARAHQARLNARDRGWLYSLFYPSEAITVLRGSREYTNGMHRVHALRVAGVDRCVVYTGRGERLLDDSTS